MSKWFCVLLIVLMLASFAGCDMEVNGPGGTTPPAGATTAADTALPSGTPPGTGTASASALGTATPAVTASPTPTGSAKPSPSPTATASSGSLSIPTVTGKAKGADALTLRETASTSGDELTQIPQDASFTVLQVETGKKWLKVEYDGKKGYVPVKYVSVGEASGDRVCTVFCDSVLNVRNGAGTGHDVIGTVASGATLVVKGKTTVSGKTWYKVVVGPSFGYVSASFCRISES